jgi:hypothetical protein
MSFGVHFSSTLPPETVTGRLEASRQTAQTFLSKPQMM